MKNIKKGIFMLLFFYCIFSCYKKTDTEDKNRKNIFEKNVKSENKSENLISIASFNAMRLGEKEKNYEVMAKIISNFDLTGIEEVMNENGLKRLRAHLIKLTGEKWEYIISESSVGSENYKEYYGYIYKSEKVQEVKKIGFYKEKNKNDFMREPYGVYFKFGNFDFIYVICHSIFGDNEKQRLIEAGNYSDVYEYFLNITEENDIIMAGDFNVPANSTAFKNLISKNNMSYILNPESDLTTFSDKKLVNSYDNFFINKEKTKEYTGRYGVYNFLRNNNGEIKKYISDHLLIFSEYSTENDLD